MKLQNNIVYENNGITVINDDTLQVNIPENSVDLIVTSPPYNLDIKYVTYSDNLTYENYLEFTKKWLAKVLLFAKTDGRMRLNIPLDVSKPSKQSIYSDLLQIAKQVGWQYHGTITWLKQNVPKRSAWGSFQSASSPFTMAPTEMIGTFYKETWAKQRKGTSSITKKEFTDYVIGLWDFKPETIIDHVAPFPEELPNRCIKLFSYVDDVILDPFMGSGTTMVSAFKNKRNAIGVDISKVYCDQTIKRLKMSGINGKANFERYFK